MEPELHVNWKARPIMPGWRPLRAREFVFRHLLEGPGTEGGNQEEPNRQAAASTKSLCELVTLQVSVRVCDHTAILVLSVHRVFPGLPSGSIRLAALVEDVSVCGNVFGCCACTSIEGKSSSARMGDREARGRREKTKKESAVRAAI